MNTYLLIGRCLLVLSGFTMVAAANAGDVVAVMGAGAHPLTKDKVADVYIGRNKDLKPVDLPESNPLREAFYKKATERDPAQIKAVWARIAFTGLGNPPKQLADDTAVKKAVADDPKAIGYIDKAHVDSTVTVVLELP